MTNLIRALAVTTLVAGLGYGDGINASSPTAPAAVASYDVTIPQGTRLRVRLQTTVASNVNRVEDPVTGVLTAPVVVNGQTVLPAGSVVRGYVSDVQPSGRVKGRASMGLRFQSVAARGNRYPIAAAFSETAAATKAKDAETIGIPAAGGAIIGAILGGKKGAAIGTAVGGGAGTAIVLSTPGKEVRLPSGTVLVLRLQRPLDVRMK
jgi:hypothetical protein